MKTLIGSKNVLRMGLPLFSAAFLGSILSPAQQVKPVITLDPQPHSSTAMATYVKGEADFDNAPANFRSFRSVKAGELGDAEPLTLRFSVTTKLTRIELTKDFKLEQGSSCVADNVYEKGGSCNLLVRFTPQGAGRQLGKLTITHTASVTPMAFGLGGYGYAPVLSFTPSQITTVPASVSGSTGILKGSLNLAVDGGDTLYVADTGNNIIRSMDSSGKFLTISSGTLSAPLGVISDNFGQVYFTEPAGNYLYEIYNYGPQFILSGSTGGACTTTTPCNVSGAEVYTPGEMAIDSGGRLFFVDGYSGAAEFLTQTVGNTYAHIYDPFTYQAATPGVIGIDSSDNLYSFWYDGVVCSIDQQSFYNAANSTMTYQKIAGGKTCGFAGDGGQARNAEISSHLGQMAFDPAGNLYFTDTGNNRVRRIDATTGIINTIAGTGLAANSNDTAASTTASVNTPTGVAVDSQGQVYILTTTSGTAQSIRKIGIMGYVYPGSATVGTAAPVKTVTVSNTGNTTMTLSTATTITGANPGDFSVDPATTTCALTAGSTLDSGQSCKVGIIFKPTAAGTRTANLIFHGNTVTNSNTVFLTGAGTAPAVKRIRPLPVKPIAPVGGDRLSQTLVQ